MEFNFESSEEYQLGAIEAVTTLFEGQGCVRSQLVIPKGFQVIANRPPPTQDEIPLDSKRNLAVTDRQRAFQEVIDTGYRAVKQLRGRLRVSPISG
jgi:hypothetical protein